jgi:hypothetical protein
MKINKHMRLITFDIKDLYVNLPITGVLQTTKNWLNKAPNNPDTNKQTIVLLKTIMEQNYFQYNN